MNGKRLTDREFDIMQILWNSDRPLLASEILKSSNELNINTIQASLRKLLNKKYIKVADILQTGKGLGRTFAPSISVNEYILIEFKNILPTSTQHRNMFFTAFLEQSVDKENTLNELEELINEYRKRMVK